VTTPQGARGYQWRSGGVLIEETAAKAAARSIELAVDENFRRKSKQAVDDAAGSAPSLEEVASAFRSALKSS
jgi:hypothetical protein